MTWRRFLFLSTTDWDAPQFGSRQQIAQLLARRGHSVLFVEVPRALHSLISAPAETRRALTRMGKIRSLEERLWAYTPLPVLPIYYHPKTNAVNQRLLHSYIRNALARLGWSHPDVFWTYWPNSAHLVGRFDERLAVYHCIDALTAVDYPLAPAGAIARMEQKLCQRVDLIFARTEELARDKQHYNPRTVYLPGGVDLNLFDPAQASEPPSDIVSLPDPRIGFVGTIDDRLDMDLLAHCVRRFPHASFVFVGPIKRHLADTRWLEAHRNVHFFPACHHQTVPNILSTLEVGLIPYRVSTYTQGLSPLKLYEYLAMGTPVVATDLPYLRRESPHIRIGQNPNLFAAAIENTLGDTPSPAVQAQWRAVAASYSWDQQVDYIEACLNAVLQSAP